MLGDVDKARLARVLMVAHVITFVLLAVFLVFWELGVVESVDWGRLAFTLLMVFGTALAPIAVQHEAPELLGAAPLAFLMAFFWYDAAAVGWYGFLAVFGDVGANPIVLLILPAVGIYLIGRGVSSLLCWVWRG